MADAGYGLLLTTSDEPQNSADSATPQTGREARNLDSDCRLLLGYLVLASAVFLAVQNIQIINDPDHPEILQQWLPWFFGPGLTPAALVWSAWSQAIILPLLGALGMASCVLRCCSGSKSFMMEFASLIASFFIFLQIALWEGQLMKGLTEPPTEERQRWVIEPSWSGHIGLLWLTKEKLHLLGWESTATYSYWMWLFWLLLRLLLRWLKLGWGSWIGAAVAIGSWPFLIFATGLQAWALWAAAEEGSQFREIRKNWAGQVDREVFFLRCAAVLTIWDSVYMPLAEHFFVPMIGFAWYLAFDAFFMLITIHILGYEAETLEDLSDMARLQGKRVTFPGKVNPEAKDCIVSFPGKYSKEWDDAVKEAQGQSSLCSLACVFLTDRQSGLGGHVENPEGGGNCFCQALYGQVNPAAYLSTVDEDKTEQELLFKKSDAEAMGQILLIRHAESDAAWNARKKEALLKADEKCKENHSRAPWGCRWFADWKENVDNAHQQGQKFHVFYFEERVGCGKMAWEDLKNETKLQEVHDSTGLGKSQTAEVAWLDRLGIPYEEHDVKDFYKFIKKHQNNNR